MVIRRLKAIAQHGKVLLEKLSTWLAKDIGIVLLATAFFCTLLSVTTYDIMQTHETTRCPVMVDKTNAQVTGYTYYPATFEPINYTEILESNMSFNKLQLRAKITAVLKHLEPEIPFSETAVELLMLTCAQETHLGKYLYQVKGPARGIFQIEPATEKDMWRTLAQSGTTKMEALRAKIGKMMFITEPKGLTNMEMNLAYQIAMARFFYYRIPKALPDYDIEEMAKYWKKYFNTYLGKGTVEEAVKNYGRFVA